MIPREARIALEEALGDGVRFDVPMARYTSLRVGGPADALAEPTARGDLARLLAICAAHRVPHVVFGGGFNALVLDGGIDGVAIRTARMRRLEERPGGALRAEAGVGHNQLTKFCLERGFSGLEFGAGIPGTVGGWIAMNAGVPEREVKDAVREVEIMSPSGARVRHALRGDLDFRYRSLRGLAPGSVVVSALFGIRISDRERVQARVDRLLARRSDTQPLNVPSCGSVFKNPPGDHAGRLIEAAGLKGHRIGGAEISTVHANFIANVAHARAADVLALIETARRTVAERSGIRLVPEVRIIGRKA